MTAIYVSRDDIVGRLDRIEEMVTRIDERVAVIPDHEQRIRWTERWMYAIPATFIMAVAGAVGVVVNG